jgi:hypothetical protein
MVVLDLKVPLNPKLSRQHNHNHLQEQPSQQPLSNPNRLVEQKNPTPQVKERVAHLDQIKLFQNHLDDLMVEADPGDPSNSEQTFCL